MELITLLQRSLSHYRRTNLAVLLGAAVGTAVLTGALLVGDSLRGSLRDLTLDRLGQVDYGLTSSRFFREELASAIEAPAEIGQAGIRCCPTILLRGTVSIPDTSRRATQVNIIGVTEGFWRMANNAPQECPTGREVSLNAPLAEELGVGPGDTVLVRVEKQSAIPRDSALGRRGDTVGSSRLDVRSVLPAEGVGRFGLRPTQLLPRNLYVPLTTLQKITEQRGRANGILVSAGDGTRSRSIEEVQQRLRRSLTLDDLGISVREGPGGRPAVVETRSLVIEPQLEGLVDRLAEGLGLLTWPILTHLANTISVEVTGKRVEIPYSTLSALDTPPGPAFGQLQLTSGEAAPGLAAEEILLNEWAASSLERALGDRRLALGTEVEISYYATGARNELVTGKATFALRGVLKMAGAAADPGLAPMYPGITDTDSILDWDPPFPVDLGAIRDEDEEYWDARQTTPKAFVSLATGQKLWGSRFGRLTSIRVASREGDLEAEEFGRLLLEAASPADFGLVLDPVKERGLAASKGSTDFGGMFVGFSMFLIASAAVLVGLLFRLGVEQRSGEVGLLIACGFPMRTLRKLFLGEGALLVAAGTALGLIGAVGYAWLMVGGLRTWWVGAVGSPFLRLHVSVPSLAIGLLASFLIVLFSVWRTIRQLGAVPARALLAGGGPEREVVGFVDGAGRAAKVGIGALVVSLALMGGAAAGIVNVTVSFFAGGALLLVAALAFLSAWLRREVGGTAPGHGTMAVLKLGARNGARHPGRSVLTAGLVACATFVIVAVATNRVDPTHKEPQFGSGDGGFALIAESDLPVYRDLNSQEGRQALGLPGKYEGLLGSATVYQLRLRPGEDASCLNVYQPSNPTILGVPDGLITRGGFGFQATIRDGGENPWEILRDELGPGVVPVFGDVNAIQWILHLKVGEDLTIRSEAGEKVRLRIAGTLKRSIFQGELLMAESSFQRLFPSRVGYQAFLIETPSGSDSSTTSTALEDGLSDFGFDAVRTADKLAEYLVVQNTYLSTFLAVGGLGLILGTLGLGMVLLRNVLERRAELAMLRALGFRSRDVVALVLAENGFLLLLGLGAGAVPALLAVAPHLLSGGSDVSWGSILLTLVAVFAVGMASGALAVAAALRGPLLPALRGE